MNLKQIRDADKFYTKPVVVKSLLKHIDFTNYDLIIEPSAGSGNFFNELPKGSIGLDLYPESTNIQKQDWLQYKIKDTAKNVLIIGNPPFGKSNNLSKAFLKHAFSHTNVKTVAFVLPNVYRKHTIQKAIPNSFIIKDIIELPNESFTLAGKSFHVPCSFFVFERGTGQDLRQDVNISSNDFTFGTKLDYDFFVFGAAPHRTIMSPKSNNRGYYIKATGKDIKTLRHNFKTINWKGYSSAGGGVSWFTKVDLIENYNKNH